MGSPALSTPVTDAHWNEEVLRGGGTVVVAFLARSSTPCLGFDVVLDEVAHTVPAAVKLLHADIDGNPLTARRYDISSLPTVLVFRAGVLRGRLIGTRSADRLRRELSTCLG